MVVDAGPTNTANKHTLQSERRSVPTKSLTEPTLLEMSDYATYQEFRSNLASQSSTCTRRSERRP